MSSARRASVERQAVDREDAFIAAIDEVRAERDRFAAELLAANAQIVKLREALESIAEFDPVSARLAAQIARHALEARP